MQSLPISRPTHLTGGTGRIDGVVQDLETGALLAGATVMIRPCSVQEGHTGHGPFLEWTPFFRTGSDGAFHIDGLPEGRFHVEAGGDGHLPHRHSHLQDLHGRPGSRLVFDILWSGAHRSRWDEAWNEIGATEELLRNQYPRIAPGESVRIVVKLRPGRVIAGHVRDSAGAPVAGATITPIHQQVWVGKGCFDANDLPPATSDSRGDFRLVVYPGADAELLATTDGFASLHRTMAATSSGSVDLTLIAAGPLRGRVVRADVRVARRTRVMIFDPSDLATALTADADETGAWTIENAPPTPFAVLAWHGYSGGCWRVVDAPTSHLDLVLHPMRTLRGQVVEPGGLPVKDEYVYQAFPFEWGNRTVNVDHLVRWEIGCFEKTDTDGRFTAKVVPDHRGKVLLRYDYHLPPASTDVAEEVRLAISEKTAESRAIQRKYAALRPEPEPVEKTAEAPASCPLPQAPKPDWSPADFESRNRLWIALLQSEPPEERVALLEQLGQEIGGG